MSNKILFTFVSITYNHSKFILQHLESIKYQILTYGQNYSFQLIIADDCSSDETIKKVKRWLEENEILFNIIDIMVNENNLGTCKNYCAGLRKIKGSYYKVLSADDLYAKENIFELLSYLDNYDIVLTPTGEFSDNELYVDMKIYSRLYQIEKFAKTSYKQLVKWFVSIPLTPGVFLRQGLITEEIMEFIERYRLIEDRSQSIKLYETYSTLKIYASKKVLVLYRYHKNAITKTNNSKIKSLYSQDSDALYKYVIENSKDLIVRLLTKYQMFMANIKNRDIARALDFSILAYRIKFFIYYLRYKKELDQIVNDSYLPNKDHLLALLQKND